MKTKGKPDKIDVYVGKRLREIREEQMFTQKELGSEVGVSFQEIQKYEKGQDRISCGRLYRICKVFGLTPNDFFPEVK